MSQIVEIRLRIPSLRIAGKDTDAPKTINNAEIRFCKQIEVDAIPKPGAVLTMSSSAGATFDSEVLRADWHHEKNMFVIACRYARKSVSAAEYHAFLSAADWQVRSLI
jgi:hypothetical protein